MDALKVSELFSKLKPRILESIGVWQSYTPVWSSSGTSPNIGNGQIYGRFCVIGKKCTVIVALTSGSTTTYGSGNYRISLPLPAKVPIPGFPIAYLGNCHIRDTTVKTYMGMVQLEPSTSPYRTTYVIPINNGTNNINWTPTYPFTFGNGDFFWMQLTYEIE